jgi:hypothetical protein
MQSATTLKNWNAHYPLLIGNEHTGNRPWKGSVSEFYIASRAASAQEVNEIFARGNPILPLSKSMVAYYKKRDSSGYYDEIGNSPRLLPRKNGSGRRGPDELTWFESSQATKYITTVLARSAQFTLGARIASEASNQNGPARIISLSNNPNVRNFTLGQAGQDLVFRLRTPLTGQNGALPSLSVPYVFATQNPRHVIVTYDGRRLLVYIDGARSHHSLELTPGLLIYNFVFGSSLPRSHVANLLYYVIIFAPLGIMLLLALKMVKLHSDFRIIALAGLGVFVVSLMLEKLLIFVSGRQLEVENIVLGMLVSYVSYLVSYLFSIKGVMLTRLAGTLS